MEEKVSHQMGDPSYFASSLFASAPFFETFCASRCVWRVMLLPFTYSPQICGCLIRAIRQPLLFLAWYKINDQHITQSPSGHLFDIIVSYANKEKLSEQKGMSER